MSLFGINQAIRSLLTHQRELEVTGQNITNVNTPGYSRQVVVTTPVGPAGAQAVDLSGNPIAPGGGVDVAQVRRTHASWLDPLTSAFQGQVGQSASDQRYATQVENLLGEPTDSGLQSTMERFFAAFGNLADHPEDTASRDSVLSAGSALALKLRGLTGGLDGLRSDAAGEIKANVNAINQLAAQVAVLNKSIRAATAADSQPSELLDQRDQLLAQLQQRAGVTVNGQDGPDAVVSVGGRVIVQGDYSEQLAVDPNDPTQVVTPSSGEPVTATGVTLGSLQAWVNTTIPGYRHQIAQVRDSLAAAVNAVHQSGTDLNGNPGAEFFTTDDQGNIDVNPDLAADRSGIVSGTGAPGDGGVARQISNLTSESAGIMPQYRTLVAQIGQASANANANVEQSNANLQQVQGMQASESGVNMDEELAQMVSLQHVYDASAKLLTVYNDMLDTLLQTAA